MPCDRAIRNVLCLVVVVVVGRWLRTFRAWIHVVRRDLRVQEARDGQTGFAETLAEPPKSANPHITSMDGTN
jgi:hypothetical protein